MTKDAALVQLRHLYSLMVAGHVKDTTKVARGLLGPAIEDDRGGWREGV